MDALSGSGVWWWLGLFSALTFLGSLILMPWIVIRMPVDSFKPQHRAEQLARRRGSIILFVLMLFRAVLGLLLVLAGVAMLVLPGQGVLTILIGLGLMEFPGKFALECRIASIGPVFNALNWIRAKAGREPFQAP